MLCVLGAGVLLSAGFFGLMRGWEHREMAKRAADLTHSQVERLQVSILRSMEVLHSIGALYAARGSVDRREFQRFVQPALDRQPELQALSWNPIVPESKRAEFEAAAVADGIAGFEFREHAGAGNFQTAAARAEYVPVYFIEPRAPNAAALGYDLASDPTRRRSLEQARDTGNPTATSPLRLAQGPNDGAGLLVLLPVFSQPALPGVAERRAALRGFAVAVFRINDLVKGVFDSLEERGIRASLYDGSPTGQRLYANAVNIPGEGEVAWLEVASRRWAVVYAPTREFAATQPHAHSWFVLAGGLAFTLLTVAYLYGGWRRTQETAAANATLRSEIIVRQQAEAAAAAANAAKSDFLASMSHEIRTPLNAILGYTQLMQRDPLLPAEQRDAVDGIGASGRHLLGLINEILDLAKIEAGRMELNPVNFDLAALGDGLAATFRPLCAQKKIRFRLELVPDFVVPVAALKSSVPGDGITESASAPGGEMAKDVCQPTAVRGDEGKLRQVLINLVGNAVKFTSVGEVCLRIQKQGTRWRFEVIDTGLGIPEEERVDIFKPFHQGTGAQHQGGTGLGLAISQRQVNLLGGKLELESVRGIGSCFHFEVELPPATEALEETAVQTLRLAPNQALRVLIVDDNRENREVLGRMLTTVGCEVVFAANGEEALRFFAAEEAPGFGQSSVGPGAIASDRELAADPAAASPAMVLLDVLLPGCSGVEIARRIRMTSQGGETKIIAHTASALPRHREEARAAGADDFLTKPFEAEQLYALLERHLGVIFERKTMVESAPRRPAAAEQVQLPAGLSTRLMAAAEFHSTTALKACLQELRATVPEAAPLADEIRHLMRSYDMDAIQKLLLRVNRSDDRRSATLV